MFKKISNKMILSFGLLIIILISGTLLLINSIFKETHINVLKREMKEKVNFIEEIFARQGTGKNLRIQTKNTSNLIGLRITVIDFKGVVRTDSNVKNISTMDNHLYRLEISGAQAHQYGSSIRYSNTLKMDMLYYAKKSNTFFIRLAKPLNEINENLSRIRTFILVIGLFVVITALIIVTIISQRITRPIHESIDFAEQFSEGNLSRRILNYSEDEIGILQKSLNRLADIIVDKINSLIGEQNKLKITIESIHDGIAVIDSNKKIILANKSFISLLDINGFNSQHKFYELIRSRSFNAKIDQALHQVNEIHFEEEFLSGKICDVFVTPLTEENSIQGVLIVVHDMTEAKKINQLKTDLVGNLSHELKTPITILKGYLETITQHLNKPDLCKEFITKALANLDRQNSIINDMLTLNMLETTKNFTLEQLDIKDIITSCVEILEPKYSKKEITVNVEIETLKDTISTNKFLAEGIFFNLIDNAISYNNLNGSINIKARQEGAKRYITIEDTGIGIPQTVIDRIFERFYRVDSSRSRATGGTGLGLAIVKHSAELLSWKISVESTDQGTSFTVEI